LPISAEKSTWMKISNKNVADQITFILDGKTLKPFNELKDLGVTFTSKLIFSNLITSILKKSNIVTFSLNKYFMTKDTSTLVRAFKIYVLPYID